MSEMTMRESSSRCPFTVSQWQELEHQALIFKYMASGIPIPHDLIRSFYLESTSTSPTQLFPHQARIGWGCYQMGFGRKAEDPEPWRCRRTDGKKWRCSKEAYPDSKYCEKHMHRGKNRSRKHVEMPIANNSMATAAPSSSSYSTTTTTTSHKPSLYPRHLPTAAASETHHLVYHCSPAPQSSSPGFNLDRDNRYTHGSKEDVDRYNFLSEAAGAERDGPWWLTPPALSSLGEPGRRSCSGLQRQGLSREQEDEKRRHCFVLGADFKLETPTKTEGEEEPQRPLRHFFGDWPSKSKDPWDEEEESRWGAFSRTQLSISIPMAQQGSPSQI